MIIHILKSFPIYIQIIKYLSQQDCLHLSLTNKYIHNILHNFGFLQILTFKCNQKSVNMYRNHKRTLLYIDIYKQDNIFKHLPILSPNIELRIRNCSNIKESKNESVNKSITKLVIYGNLWYNKIHISVLNKFINLKELYIDNWSDRHDWGDCVLNNLEKLKLRGNFDISKLKCINLKYLYYNISNDKSPYMIDITHFKRVQFVYIHINMSTNLRQISLSSEEIKIIQINSNNSTVYEKNFNTNFQTKYTKSIKNIKYNNNIINIFPTLSTYNNLYYY